MRFAGDVLVYAARSCHCVTQIGAAKREGVAGVAVTFPICTVCPDHSSHGVFAPSHPLRAQVTPARRGRRKAATANEPAPARHVSMT